jgi:hypothetical protein
MSGANYYTSTKQVLDSDRKIRAVSLLKFSGISLTEIDAAIQCENSLKTIGSAINEHTADDVVEQLTCQHLPDISDLNVIYYVAGYIARSVCRITRCDSLTGAGRPCAKKRKLNQWFATTRFHILLLLFSIASIVEV